MRPIAAFSMEDYERLTRNSYQAVEFKRGKDKQKRKKRGAGFYAGVGAAGLAGAGALGYGTSVGLRAGKKRAIGQLMPSATAEGGKYSNYREKMKNNTGSNLMVREPGFIGRSKNIIGQDAKRLSNLGSSAKQRAMELGSKAKGALGTTGGKIGAGLGAAALLGGAGYGAYRMMNKKKKK